MSEYERIGRELSELAALRAENARLSEQRRLAVAYLSDCLSIISELGGGTKPDQTVIAENAEKFLDEHEDKAWDSSRCKALCEQNARLREVAGELRDALSELTELMDDVRSAEYHPDSFTNQPARAALAKAKGVLDG